MMLFHPIDSFTQLFLVDGRLLLTDNIAMDVCTTPVVLMTDIFQTYLVGSIAPFTALFVIFTVENVICYAININVICYVTLDHEKKKNAYASTPVCC